WVVDGACRWPFGCVAVLSFSTAPAPPQLYTLSLHDALPISPEEDRAELALLVLEREVDVSRRRGAEVGDLARHPDSSHPAPSGRSEEHTSELQSLRHLVCRLLLEKKKHIHSAPANASDIVSD